MTPWITYHAIRITGTEQRSGTNSLLGSSKLRPLTYGGRGTLNDGVEIWCPMPIGSQLNGRLSGMTSLRQFDIGNTSGTYIWIIG
jgi:hypothetical protein